MTIFSQFVSQPKRILTFRIRKVAENARTKNTANENMNNLVIYHSHNDDQLLNGYQKKDDQQESVSSFGLFNGSPRNFMEQRKDFRKFSQHNHHLGGANRSIVPNPKRAFSEESDETTYLLDDISSALSSSQDQYKNSIKNGDFHYFNDEKNNGVEKAEENCKIKDIFEEEESMHHLEEESMHHLEEDNEKTVFSSPINSKNYKNEKARNLSNTSCNDRFKFITEIDADPSVMMNNISISPLKDDQSYKSDSHKGKLND